MGCLKVDIDFFNKETDLLRATFLHLRREHNAVIENQWVGKKEFIFLINGEGIPKDRQEFGLNLVYLVEGVFMVEIVKYG
jgi:hypothetical protein